MYPNQPCHIHATFHFCSTPRFRQALPSFMDGPFRLSPPSTFFFLLFLPSQIFLPRGHSLRASLSLSNCGGAGRKRSRLPLLRRRSAKSFIACLSQVQRNACVRECLKPMELYLILKNFALITKVEQILHRRLFHVCPKKYLCKSY